MAKHSRQTLGIFFTLSGGICWGFSGACGQYLFTNYQMPSDYLTCVRMILSGLILAVICLFTSRRNMVAIWKNKADILRLLAFSVFGLLFCQFTYLTTISYSNAGTATVLQYIGPIFILVADCIIQRKPPQPIEIIAMALALAGTFLLATHGHPGSLVLSREALIWGLLSAVALALYTTLSYHIAKKYGSQVVMCYGLLIGGFLFALVPGTLSQGVSLNGDGYLAMAGIILVGTVLAYTIYICGVSYIGPVRSSLFSSIEPVSATLFAVLWLHTQFQPIDLLGFACILSTIFLLAYRKTQTN